MRYSTAVHRLSCSRACRDPADDLLHAYLNLLDLDDEDFKLVAVTPAFVTPLRYWATTTACTQTNPMSWRADRAINRRRCQSGQALFRSWTMNLARVEYYFAPRLSHANRATVLPFTINHSR